MESDTWEQVVERIERTGLLNIGILFIDCFEMVYRRPSSFPGNHNRFPVIFPRVKKYANAAFLSA